MHVYEVCLCVVGDGKGEGVELTSTQGSLAVFGMRSAEEGRGGGVCVVT